MGLDTSHDCWHGSYSSFMAWRRKVAEVSGYGNLDQYEGFFDSPFARGIYADSHAKSWPNNKDVLQVLLQHSDCDGDIKAKDCKPLADRLSELIPAMKIAGDYYVSKTEQFIKGLRLASKKKQKVNFH